IFGYATGDAALSITQNGVNNFAMLYYTLVLGLSPVWAGIALSVTLVWDAVTDPVMGHITDHTRTRFGRRHIYILSGGLLMAGFFFALWFLPPLVSSTMGVFWMVLVISLLLRTALTVFVVPYVALGFEICPEYAERSKLQGIRFFVTMATNFLFGAMAWTLFFKDGVDADTGRRIDGTSISSNYLNMGTVLALGAIAAILFSVWTTRRHAVDNRDTPLPGKGMLHFVHSMTAIFRDRLAWFVFAFFGVVQLGMMLTSQMQMFTYVFFMELTHLEKTFVHGAGMVAFGLCSLSLAKSVDRFDKKPVGYLGIAMGIVGGLSLTALFTTGLLDPRASLTLGKFAIPAGVIAFGLGQALWWGGCGMLTPLAASMIADASEVNYRRHGVLKDGSYASAFSFFTKAAQSLGLAITGYLIRLSGIEAEAESQTSEAVRNIAAMTFLCGPALLLVVIYILRKYPIDRDFMKRIREERTS
ncbi:MAG TPA: MFS transporter, partial [Oceanipulchritudo sp.]|nr:MFS transporter [Oceanipulchritudo sp.]